MQIIVLCKRIIKIYGTCRKKMYIHKMYVKFKNKEKNYHN